MTTETFIASCWKLLLVRGSQLEESEVKWEKQFELGANIWNYLQLWYVESKSRNMEMEKRMIGPC